MSLFDELRRRNVFRVGIAYGVTAWLLIQVSDTVFPRIGLSESAVTLVIALLAIGFVPAVIFAWAFELTPEGIKRERDVERAESITPQTGKKLDRVIIVVLAGVVAWFLFNEHYLEPRMQLADPVAAPPAAGIESETVSTEQAPQPDSRQKSIAVLPFVNMSADAENEYFSDGIAEELLNVLVRVSALEVASRTSSFAYKGKDLPLSQIANELGVNHILEGSVRKAGNRVRVTAQLINASSDRHLWSDTYERELDDIFDIQEEISNHIVEELKIALDVDEAADMARLQRPTDNTEAYELYLQGRYKWRQRLEENIRASIGLFEQAIALDPNFAKAHEALAVAHMVLPAWSRVPIGVAIDEASIHAERALAIDPRLAEARTVKAEIAVQNLRWAESIDLLEAALEYEPRNASVRQWYAETLADVGYLGQALQQIERAYQLDPASPVINNVYTYVASAAGEDELSIRHMNTAMQLGMDFAVLNAIEPLMNTGNWGPIEEIAIPVAEELGDPVSTACFRALLDPGHLPEAEQMLAEWADTDNSRRASRYSLCAAHAGRLDLASRFMEVALSHNPANIGQYWGPSSRLAGIRARDEFKQALADLKLVDLYRERGWPEYCRPTGAEDFACD